ncbi:hypothetical protein BDY24DRAFT_385208 [Mrakia frigida]|uniref:uncharacterized protein n=1 Tax=Mrakia frigida TaxID=29902 RepID=UPI003FCC1D3B
MQDGGGRRRVDVGRRGLSRVVVESGSHLLSFVEQPVHPQPGFYPRISLDFLLSFQLTLPLPRIVGSPSFSSSPRLPHPNLGPPLRLPFGSLLLLLLQHHQQHPLLPNPGLQLLPQLPLLPTFHTQLSPLVAFQRPSPLEPFLLLRLLLLLSPRLERSHVPILFDFNESAISTMAPPAAGFVDFVGRDFKNFEHGFGSAAAAGRFFDGNGNGNDNSSSSPTPLDDSFFIFGGFPHSSNGSPPDQQASRQRAEEEEAAALVVVSSSGSRRSGSTPSFPLRSGSRLEVPREGLQGCGGSVDGADLVDGRTKQWWDGLLDIHFDFNFHHTVFAVPDEHADAAVPDAWEGVRGESGREGDDADGCVRRSRSRNEGGQEEEVDWVFCAEVMGLAVGRTMRA